MQISSVNMEECEMCGETAELNDEGLCDFCAEEEAN